MQSQTLQVWQVKNHIYSGDALGESQRVLEACNKWEAQQRCLRIARGQREAELRVAEAERDCYQEHLQDAAERSQGKQLAGFEGPGGSAETAI